MDKLNVKLENCFGIGSINHTFDFTKKNSILIYSSNGTMKTSFAKVFDLYAQGKQNNIQDTIFSTKKTNCDIKFNDSPLLKESIFVINGENEYDASDKITTFLASNVLKERYDSIYEKLENLRKHFITGLKGVSQSSDCESELLSTFSSTSNDTLYTILHIINAKRQEYCPSTYTFKYNEIFDKGEKVKAFLDKHRNDIESYFKTYKELLTHSKFYKTDISTGKNFGTYQASELIKAVEDDSFFVAGHKLVLADESPIKSFAELKSLTAQEQQRILSDKNLKKNFETIDKAIGSNNDLRNFKLCIEKDNSLLLQLLDYDEFRKKVWCSFISMKNIEFESLFSEYENKKKELKNIVTEAQNEQDKWKKILDIFNDRFHVPFEVKINNQKDVVLSQTTANLSFEYRDSDKERTPTNLSKQKLLEVLSKGEKRAFFILQILFEIEVRKKNDMTLLICDDISDSFDYQNKYAIIEYLQEISEQNMFKMILLTHNFDFYRTVASRFGLSREKEVLMCIKNANRKIEFKQGQYIKSVFSVWGSSNLEPNLFIACIPFIRNIIEYTRDDNEPDYITLTKCLHIKTEVPTVDTIKTLIKNYLPKILFSQEITSMTIHDFIFQTADNYSNDNDNDILLENKILIAIAIRLKAEDFMLKYVTPTEIRSNQTIKLFKLFEKQHSSSHSSLSTLRKVNLMTPEHIHINAFMYEPLIDMSIRQLLELYKAVKALTV